MVDLVMHDAPIFKTAAQMKSGDVYKTAFGDEYNVGLFVFEACRPAYNGRTTEIDYHKPLSSAGGQMYELEPIDKVTFEVVGKEIKE